MFARLSLGFLKIIMETSYLEGTFETILTSEGIYGSIFSEFKEEEFKESSN